MRVGAVALGALLFVLVLVLSLAYVARRAEAAIDRGCESVVVSVDWDRSRAARVSGVVVRVGYPASLEMPSSGNPDSSKDRVALLTGTSGGLFDAVPRDSDHDGRKDVVSIGLITQGIGPGPFARLRFDCAPGMAPAKAAEITCTADVADESGSVPSSCSVALAAE
ncbi:hypothetical protein K2Z84_27440 [Candidatus Binatia bacterium]|nr:hypothetical protein [Candidatus Binatia bacterium]